MTRSTEQPENVNMAGSTEEHENVQGLWLKTLMEDHPEKRQETPIQKVPSTLRQVKTNDTYFVPKVVSLGPYHRSPKPMNYLKDEAVQWFISLLQRPDSDCEVRKIQDGFETEARGNKPFRDWYAANHKTIEQLKDEDFSRMMFVDGCFILYHVFLLVKTHDIDVSKKTHDIALSLVRYIHIHQPFILSDMFLLENQIPYGVLKSLLNLMPKPKVLEKGDIVRFIERLILEHSFLDRRSFPEREGGLCFGKTSTVTRSTARIDKEPLHLLDMLRTNLILRTILVLRTNLGPITKRRSDDRHYVRSIMELKAKGIKIHKSRFNDLSEIKFKEGIIHGHLSLPQMIINDRTRTQLLNLIAYEMCLDSPSDHSHPARVITARVITSYVCFLDCLIDHADDVKELRSKGILRNRLGSDEEVAKLFNEVATNSIPDPSVYEDTLQKIQKHCEKKLKVWVAEVWYNHFRSPWTIISLTAAIFFLFLSVVQTIFTVW